MKIFVVFFKIVAILDNLLKKVWENMAIQTIGMQGTNGLKSFVGPNDSIRLKSHKVKLLTPEEQYNLCGGNLSTTSKKVDRVIVSGFGGAFIGGVLFGPKGAAVGFLIGSTIGFCSTL